MMVRIRAAEIASIWGIAEGYRYIVRVYEVSIASGFLPTYNVSSFSIFFGALLLSVIAPGARILCNHKRCMWVISPVPLTSYDFESNILDINLIT